MKRLTFSPQWGCEAWLSECSACRRGYERPTSAAVPAGRQAGREPAPWTVPGKWGKRGNWGRWGEQDKAGCSTTFTPEMIVKAASW